MLEVLSTEVWPCNFFQRIDNNGDTYHVPFVHRDAYSASAANNRSGLPEISGRKPWGNNGVRQFYAPAGATSFNFSCPTSTPFETHRPNRSVHGKTGMQWDVPLDDEHSLEFRLRRLPLTGEAADAYREPAMPLPSQNQNFRRANGRCSTIGQATFPGPG